MDEEPKAIHFIIVGLLVVVSFMFLLNVLNPQSKPTEPWKIYFYDANGNPDGWGEVR